jgi:hypothetical protein
VSEDSRRKLFTVELSMGVADSPSSPLSLTGQMFVLEELVFDPFAERVKVLAGGEFS